MTKNETRRYEGFVRVDDFGDTFGDALPESSLAKALFAAVKAARRLLSQFAVKKMSAAREGKSTKAMARDALRHRLEEVSGTARAMGRVTPGLEDRFRVPPSRTDQALITAGRLFARDGEEFKDEFLAHAMPQTFLADLIALVEAFESAIQEREGGRGGSSAARASIKAALASGTEAVERLDAIAKNHFRDDPGMKAQWETARRVDHPRRVRKPKAKANATTAVAPPPAETSPGTDASSEMAKA